MEKVYYSIKEVSSLLKEPETTLRYWEEKFPEIIKPTRNERGVRFYKISDLEDIRTIKYMIRDRRLTLDGVRKILKNNIESVKKQARIVMKLQNIKAELKALRSAIDNVEKII